MVFISYSEEDGTFVELLIEKLKSENIRFWIDKDSIKPGTDWSEEIETGIRNSMVLLVILTESSCKSSYITFEWAFALGKGVSVIPILYKVQESLIHPRLSSFQYIKFGETRNKPWKQLIDQINANIENPRPSKSLMVRELIDSALKVVSNAMATPSTPEKAKLRAFTFAKRGNKLVCDQFWAPYKTQEVAGLTFEINKETRKKVAVVQAAIEKQVVAVSVKPLPPRLSGVHGKIEEELCFVLAAPIIGPDGDVWGTVDFDASNEIGKKLLKTQIAQHVLFELGKHLYLILK